MHTEVAGESPLRLATDRQPLRLIPSIHNRFQQEPGLRPSIDTFITIDTEFSAGGYLHDPVRNKPVTDRAVYCRINGRSHGLGFLLETMKEFGVCATFFVEAAHCYVLGHEPMRPAVQDILAAGQDLQLHVHPMWLHGSERRAGCPLTDAMAELSSEQIEDAIAEGLRAFEAWGAPKPVAFRVGSLRMRRKVYPVLKKLGIPISSSVGAARAWYDGEGIAIENGRKWVDGVLEVPVLCYTDLKFGPKRHKRNLSVVGSGAGEILSVLKRAAAAGVEDAVILSHPFEFIKRSSGYYQRIAPNPIVQGRFRTLCRALASGPIPSRTMADKAEEWLRGGDVAPISISSALHCTLGRIVVNKANEHFRRP